MFHVSRWASIFISTLDENADTGLEYLKALIPPIKTIHAVLSGRVAARQLENILRECVSAPESGPAAGSLGYAGESVIRFLTLMVEKNRFGEIDSIVQKIEELLNEKRGILAVTAETAVPIDSVFEEDLRRRIMRATGAAQVKMKTRLAPELIGGFKLHIGSFFIDASLKGQVEKMRADLEAAALVSSGGMCP